MSADQEMGKVCFDDNVKFINLGITEAQHKMPIIKKFYREFLRCFNKRKAVQSTGVHWGDRYPVKKCN